MRKDRHHRNGGRWRERYLVHAFAEKLRADQGVDHEVLVVTRMNGPKDIYIRIYVLL